MTWVWWWFLGAGPEVGDTLSQDAVPSSDATDVSTRVAVDDVVAVVTIE